jgi:hypothetical protein
MASMQPPADEQGGDNDSADDKQQRETASPAEALSPRRRIVRFVE